ncbi:vitellogenin domain-containing protein [Trichonephila clavipes]|nr:vitellogenin domain-containing protein [Trichonephila clavipes]
MTAGIQGMRPQVSKAVLTGELKIYAKTKTDLILSMHNILVSKTEANISSSKDFVQLDPCPDLEEHMKIPIKCRYENGKGNLIPYLFPISSKERTGFLVICRLDKVFKSNGIIKLEQ